MLEREVRANLVYRQFTRVGAAQSARRQDLGQAGPRARTRDHREDASAGGGDRAGEEDRRWAPAARGYHGGGDRHSLSDRQQLAGRRGAGADAHDEENRTSDRRGGRQAARPHAQRALSRDRDWPGEPQPQRAGQGEAEADATRSCLAATGRVVGQAKRFAREVAAGVKRGASLVEQVGLEAQRGSTWRR